MSYRIFINTPQGKLTFKGVSSYKEEGSFIQFQDKLTKRILMYPIINCHIEVEQ